MNKKEPTRKELIQFALLVGGILVFLGAWPAIWRGEALIWWLIAAGGTLAVLGVTAPSSLKAVHRAWMTVGYFLGWVNTRLILGVVFYGLMTPMGLVMRAFGWDAMRRQRAQEMNSYRVVRQPRPSSHMRNQF